MSTRRARTWSNGLPAGSLRSQSTYVFPGINGHSSPHPIVTTTSAQRARSSVSGAGRFWERSIPTSRIASTTAACSCSAGRVPADLDSWRPSAARANSASLICDRPAFWWQTNSTRVIAGGLDEHVEQGSSLRLEGTRQAGVGPYTGLGHSHHAHVAPVLGGVGGSGRGVRGVGG